MLRIMSVPSPLHQSHSSAQFEHDGSGSGSDSDDEHTTTRAASNPHAAQLAALAQQLADADVDVESLNPLSPEVISKQATINIGKS